ncbi:uncharacterized protein znf518b [Maylandia zebra]|uniref:uncharacterized protein znf518b n=1 Tax=Maylandia zebra TaxID=106582 RepID=UPI00403D39C3
MKPVSYQSMPSSVNGGHPNLSLDRVLTTSNVRYCEKCGFASTDASALEKHMVEHMGTRFYCFYCNDISYSEAELNAHLKRHTSKYPFKCPHCGQGYMRRLCLFKHIERLHNKSIIQVPAKPGVTKNPQDLVPSALTSLHAADPSSLRPVVRVTVPSPSVPAVRLGKDEQRAKTLETKVSNVTNGNPERLSPLNGLIQHNRALTVSLPEEVTIPAGCLVELVEVKTVNGTKELKLRLVSQQENESVIKDTRMTVSQNTALGKPLSSTLINHTNTVRPGSMSTSTINRKSCDTKMVNVERPAVVPVSISNNLPVTPVSKEKSGLKRVSPEIINLESNVVIPNKFPKNIISPVREGVNSGIRVTQTAPVSHVAPLPVISNRVTSRLNTTSLHPSSMVSQRVMDERKTLLPEYPKSVPSRRAGDTKNMQDMPVAMKVEPGNICFKSSTASKPIKEVAPSNQDRIKSTSPSIRSSIVPTVQVRPPICLVSKDNVPTQSFSLPKTINKLVSVKTPVFSNHAKSKSSTWMPEVRLNELAKERDVSEPESFPIISSVFSLSQQPEDAQGPIQPLVMALRGIVMDKSSSSVGTTQDQVKITNTEHMDKTLTLGPSPQVETKNKSFIRESLLTEPVEAKDHNKGVHHSPALTHNHVDIKEEKKIPLPPDDNKSSHSPASKSSTHEESNVAEHAKASETEEPLEQMVKSEQDSKFLTVTLKRVQVGVWKQTKKGLKLRISKYKTQVPVDSVTDCTVIYPMPLKVDQPVKRPGPNQPVVVLNHPKPRGSAQRMRADPFANTGASEVVPKCQILKMRLSKVMGQKYEVMGCTVRVFP